MLLDAALLVPGAVVTESVFAWPGVGSLFTEALGRRDYTVLMAMLMVSSLAVIVFNLLADVVHAWLDPAGARHEARLGRPLAALVLDRAPWRRLLAPYAPRRASISPTAASGAGPSAALVRHRRPRPRRASAACSSAAASRSPSACSRRRSPRASGVAVGAVAGYAGGWTDTVLMRGTDAMLSIPRLLLLMVAAATLQPSVPALVLLVGAVGWMETARVTRAAVRGLVAREFVVASLAAGAGHRAHRLAAPARQCLGRDPHRGGDGRRPRRSWSSRR